MEEITVQTLQDWFNDKACHVKVATAAAYLYQVQTFLAWCCDDERHLLERNPADKVKIPRHTKGIRYNYLPLPDAQRLIDSCVDVELRFALYCAIHAGFRYIECVMARAEWFDTEHRVIHMQQSNEWQTKNRKNRTVPMTREFQQFLVEVYGLRSPFMIAPNKVRAEHWRYRFDFKRRFERLLMQTGINCTFHDLRRTFSSLRVQAGVSIYKVAHWAGHNVETAERHYGHLAPADSQIDIGLERRTPQPVVALPKIPPHQKLSRKKLQALVWEKPLTRAAHELGITDNGLKKRCRKLGIELPPQGYWSTPPDRRAKFLERANRSHHGLSRGE